MIAHQKVKIVTLTAGTEDLLSEIESMIAVGSSIVSVCPVNPECTQALIVYSENVLQHP